MSDSIVLGVDIGGSHITAALVNLTTKALLEDSHVRMKVNAHGTTSEIIEVWSKAITMAFSKYQLGQKKIGIAIPGEFDYKNGISLIKNQDKYDALYLLNVKELLAEALSIGPDNIQMVNDAESFLRGEAFSGAAKDYKHAIGLTLGTGLGSARYHEGVAADAGRWSSPFREGIAEDYLSTRWFKETYEARAHEPIPDVKAIAEKVSTNQDQVAVAIFNEFGRTLSEFLVPFIQEDHPEVIVLGGNIVNAAELFFPALEESLQNSSLNIPVRKAILGEEAALIGAASSWSNGF